jgi:outer membrane protein TolC
MTKRYLIISFCLFLSFYTTKQFAQNSGNTPSDSLTYKQVIQRVFQNYPAVKQAEAAIQTAETKIRIAKSALLPNIEASATYTRIGPVPTIDFPSMGEFKLYPENNYNASIGLNMTLWDFGKTDSKMDVENQSKNIAGQSVDLVKQKISLAVVNIFFSLVYVQEALRLKDMQITNLEELIKFIEKKYETGSATRYELLSTKVKLTTIQNQKIDFQTIQRTLITSINMFTGNDAEKPILLKKELSVQNFSYLTDSALVYAFNHRVELLVSKQKEELLSLQYKLVKHQTNPSLDLFGSAGAKNGYVPDMNKIKPNFAAGVSFHLPVFDANRKINNLSLITIETANLKQEAELIKRNITNEVIENLSNLESVTQKIKHNETQLDMAQEAFNLAKISYSTGVITNLDLLNSQTSLFDSQIQLLKSKIDYTLAIYKLNISMGNRIYE